MTPHGLTLTDYHGYPTDSVGPSNHNGSRYIIIKPFKNPDVRMIIFESGTTSNVSIDMGFGQRRVWRGFDRILFHAPWTWFRSHDYMIRREIKRAVKARTR